MLTLVISNKLKKDISTFCQFTFLVVIVFFCCKTKIAKAANSASSLTSGFSTARTNEPIQRQEISTACFPKISKNNCI